MVLQAIIDNYHFYTTFEILSRQSQIDR